ncbi:MAG: thiol:disulfide interchange protein DsbA/DsbL [Rhodospirillaceae bacterium]
MVPNKGRRTALRLLAALPLAAASARAQEAGQHARLNVSYREIPPQPVPAGSAIEVVEFFWYGCPYCFQFHPHFQAWVHRQPADVTVRRVPAVFRQSWIPHARMYYTLERLGALDRLHDEVYKSYHVDEVPLNTADAIADWAAKHGLDRERWLTVYRSDEVSGRLMDAQDQLRRYAVSGTPSVVVGGRYLTSSGMTPGVAAMIPVLDELVALARGQRGVR